MKITKKEFARIIQEAVASERALMQEADSDVDSDTDTDTDGDLGSSETDAGILQHLQDLTSDQLQNVVSAGEQALGVDIDQDGDVDSDESDPDTDTEPDSDKPAAPAKAAKPKIKRSAKTAYIQKVISAPSSDGGKKEGDGQWGQNTSTAWKAWIKTPETEKKLLSLAKDQGKINESSDLFNLFSKIISEAPADAPADDAPEDAGIPDDLKKLLDDGAAGPIASYFGYKGNLTGVDELVRALEDIELPKEEEEDADQAGEDEEAVEVTEAPSDPDVNFKLDERPITIPLENFRQDSSGNPLQPRSKGRIVPVTITQEDEFEFPKEISKDGMELKNFKRMFFIKDSGSIIIKRAGKNYELKPFKREGNFVVEDRSEESTPEAPADSEAPAANESLSRGALIRKRYYGRY